MSLFGLLPSIKRILLHMICNCFCSPESIKELWTQKNIFITICQGSWQKWKEGDYKDWKTRSYTHTQKCLEQKRRIVLKWNLIFCICVSNYNKSFYKVKSFFRLKYEIILYYCKLFLNSLQMTSLTLSKRWYIILNLLQN